MKAKAVVVGDVDMDKVMSAAEQPATEGTPVLILEFESRDACAQAFRDGVCSFTFGESRVSNECDKWTFENGILWNRETNGMATMASEFVLPQLIAELVADANELAAYRDAHRAIVALAANQPPMGFREGLEEAIARLPELES